MKQIENTNYFITTDGKVFNKHGYQLSPVKNKKGYHTVKLWLGNKKEKRFSVHRLVAIAYIPNPEDKQTVNHKDGNKLNNNVSNLEWMTFKENVEHAKNVLQAQKGDKATKLTINSEIVIEICKLLEQGWRNMHIAELLDVNRNIVRDIRTRKSWTHISKDYVFFKSK